jgi:PAS domain S-box-containing protein
MGSAPALPDEEDRLVLHPAYVTAAGDRRFEASLEHTGGAVALFAADGTILHASDANRRILGRDPASMVGTSAFALIHPDDHAFCRARLETCVARPAAQVDVFARVLHADGTWRELEGVFTNLLHVDGVHAIVNNYRDRAERRVAHDFNNILTAILGHVELMRRRAGNDHRLAGWIDGIEYEAQRAAALTQLLLPNQPAPSGARAPTGAEGSRPALRPQPRVLVVDDELTVRRAVSRVLGREGYEVVEAESVGSALTQVRRTGELDMILSDVRLPDGDGFELARAASMLAPHVRFLMMSGYTAADQDDRGPLLHKPFTPGELLDAVARALV